MQKRDREEREEREGEEERREGVWCDICSSHNKEATHNHSGHMHIHRWIMSN